jgi:hypothetical protein
MCYDGSPLVSSAHSGLGEERKGREFFFKTNSFIFFYTLLINNKAASLLGSMAERFKALAC